ncbi:hypothetical protein OVA14_04925 [Agrococcus sp. SL85]|uniref:hypothetical protein n=1 Tax=Agrococcus sp. SL85 TaxID=2995141 RepID=UPI00226C92B9|nr:hypothetical protein [Agrococcus sp. SL85]WAC67097.1 hypothetical protein OVA14_04925 [Agrococcus sp. SL85]
MRGLGLLLGSILRRERLLLLVWTVGIVGLWAAGLGGVGAAFDEEARRGLVALLAAQPALLLLRGAPAGIELGAVMFVSTAGYLAVMLGLMLTFFAVRHSRGDEDAGRAELVRGGAVGRWAPLAATVLAGLVEVAVVIGLFLAVSVAQGLDAWPSTLAALGLAGVGVAALLVGILAAQAMPSSRGANSAAALIVGAWFVVRGIGDALGEASADLTRVTPAWPAWASPIGWASLAHPFADPPWEPDPTPLLLFVPLVLVLGGAVVAVESRRELGGSLLRSRRGRGTGSPLVGMRPLGAPLGLALRVTRGGVIVWVVVAAVLGAVAGRLAPAVAGALDDNPALRALVQAIGQDSGTDTEGIFLTALAGIVGVLACAAAMQPVLRLRHEELAHGETVLAAAVRRTGWLASHLLPGLLASLLTLAVFAGVVGGSLAAAGDERWSQLVAIQVTHLPLVGIFLAAAAAIVAFVPAAAQWLGWLLLVGLLLVGEFAPLFGVDWEWVQRASPFFWVANPLDAEPDWAGSWWMLGVAAALLAAAFARFARRDVTV